MQRLRKPLFWALILSESSHILCCVFPVVFSILGLLAGLGVLATLPPTMVWLHDALHDWEIPIIVFSGFMLALGWAVDVYARKMDCHDTGCGHGPCTPVKKKAHIVLKIATVLFAFNLLIYFGFHYGAEHGQMFRGEKPPIHSHDSHNHAH